MIQNRLLRKFLCFDQFKALGLALNSQWKQAPLPTTSILLVFFAVTVSLFPSIAFHYRAYFPMVDIFTLAIGLATVFAFLYRYAMKLCLKLGHDWKNSLSIVQTSFALGVLPLVVIMIFFPESTHEVNDIISYASKGGDKKVVSTIWDAIGFVFKVAVWAGVTEELVYRGMLVSALRRAPLFSSHLNTQRSRDLFAVTLSAVIFGVGHFGIWGPTMAVALSGIGAGFAIAYIALREALLPLIVFHILFDACLLYTSPSPRD